MTHPKPSNLSLRYLIAGLKPLGNVKVWASLGIMGLVSVSLWQYYLHPEWLSGDSLPSPTVPGEFDPEVGNNLDIGVQLQDFEDIAPNPQEVPLPPSPIKGPALENPLGTTPAEEPIMADGINTPLLPSSSEANSPDSRQKQPSVGFQPLIPSFKDLGSLFPPLTPSSNSTQPIKIPDRETLNTASQDNALKDALENVFSSPSPSYSQNDNQRIPSTTRQGQPNYPKDMRTTRQTPYPDQAYPQPYYNPYGQTNNYSPPNNTSNPYSQQPYTTQPHNNPYGNGTAPVPVPAYPPSNNNPNVNGNVNPNYPTQPNQNRQQTNYGVQPPQVNGYDDTAYY